MVQISDVQSVRINLELSILLYEFLSHFGRMVLLGGIVVESTYLFLIALELLAVLPLVTLRMIQFLDCGVGFVAKEPIRAHGHIYITLNMFTIFRRVIKIGGWPSEVSHVVSIDTVLRIMRLVPVRTPGTFVFEHVESK